MGFLNRLLADQITEYLIGGYHSFFGSAAGRGFGRVMVNTL